MLVETYDLLPEQPKLRNPSLSLPREKRPKKFDTPQESVHPRTATVQGVNIFSSDQTGVMAFIRRTNIHVEKRLELAMLWGRNPEGLMHFGVALHAIEDLFAHSNWVEIAVSKVLQDNTGIYENEGALY